MTDVPMWDAVFENARIVTMEGTGPIAIRENAAFAVSGGRIAWLGDQSELQAGLRERGRRPIARYDVAGRLVTPGLIDCHTHLVYAGNRAREWEMRLEGASYEQIARAGGGILSTVRATRSASEELLRKSAAERLSALCREGVTTVEIKSGYGLDHETELKLLRVARSLGKAHPVTVCKTYLGAHAIPPECADGDSYLDEVCERTLPAIAREALADAVDAFCESIAFTPAQVRRYFDAAVRLGLPVKLHADQLSDGGGATLGAEYRALSVDHLEHASEAGVASLARAGTVAVLLPGAFYFLHETHRPPVDALRRHGVAMAIATDSNPGTAPIVSLLLVLNMACTLFGFTPEEALRGVTVNAARALGIERQTGRLAAGMAADAAVWNVGEVAELAYALGANPCAMTIKGGQVVRDER